MFKKQIEEKTAILNQLLREIQQLQNVLNQKNQEALRLDGEITGWKEAEKKLKEEETKKDEPSDKK